MKKLATNQDAIGILLGILLIFTLLYTGSCAKGSSLPTMSIETIGGSSDATVHLIDRQVTGITLNTAEKGYVTLEIKMFDKLQIANKTMDIPWTTRIRLQESDVFKVMR